MNYGTKRKKARKIAQSCIFRNNAPAQSAHIAVGAARDHGLKILPHPLRGRKYESDEEVIGAVGIL